MRTELRDTLLKDDGDLNAFRSVIGPLSAEFDPYEVALAAAQLAHQATGTPREPEEIPAVELPAPDDRRDRKPRAADPWPPGHPDQRRGRRGAAGTTRLFVGAGRAAGVRPQDLVGAITGHSHLTGRDIGGIEIADRFSLVEVPESAADDVITALRQTSIRGRSATVRRERFSPR
jgi:ATP-dependent RNA helicase DeaD